MATTATTRTTSGTASSATATRTASTAAPAPVAVSATSVSATLGAGRGSASTRRSMSGIDTVKVGLLVGVKIGAAFDHGCWRSVGLRNFRGGSRCSLQFRRWSPTHFRALLFQDRFARQLDAVAFDSQHFHQHLVALFQLVANLFNSVLGDLADVQQAIGTRDDLDERSELGQPGDFAQVGLPYLSRRRHARQSQ